MITDVRITYQIPGCEACFATLETTVDGKTVTKTLNFGGNAIYPILHGAISIVNELQEMLGKEPEGHVQIPVKKKKRRS